jgi:phage shock protein C
MLYNLLIFIFLLIGPAIGSIAFLRRLSSGWHLFLLSCCVFYGISPFLATWGALGLAKLFDCSAKIIRVSCSSPIWLGDVISEMRVSYWLAIFFIPSAVLGVIGLLFSWILNHQRSRTTGDTSGQSSSAFHRSRRHKVIAGICSAIAQRWHQPIQLIRIVAIILVVVNPVFICLYFWSWLAFPIEPLISPPMEEH